MDTATGAREKHCTHPNQAWCDYDWCRLVKAAERTMLEVGWSGLDDTERAILTAENAA